MLGIFSYKCLWSIFTIINLKQVVFNASFCQPRLGRPTSSCRREPGISGSGWFQLPASPSPDPSRQRRCDGWSRPQSTVSKRRRRRRWTTWGCRQSALRRPPAPARPSQRAASRGRGGLRVNSSTGKRLRMSRPEILWRSCLIWKPN